ncbi:MAG: formyltetrahydrofolate deformylase [Chitinivibrionales bacterium]
MFEKHSEKDAALETAILLVQCSDQKGIVAKISDFVYRYNGNIHQSDQYSTDPENGRFFMRLEFCFDPKQVPAAHLEKEFEILAGGLKADWTMKYASTRMKMGIMVSRFDHCLVELLYLWRSGELRVDIPVVISNHPDVEDIVKSYGVTFQYLPVRSDSKRRDEQKQLELLQDTDFLVLARYMQILSGDFIAGYGKDIINIHHSFLPSFKGANPYRQAYDRGVKVIGATAHYVTEDLDEGPIIDQVVERVSHRDTVQDLKRKGKHLEQIALANAIRAHVEHRVIRFRNKTIVFA